MTSKQGRELLARVEQRESARLKSEAAKRRGEGYPLEADRIEAAAEDCDANARYWLETQ
jgi:hypothetical protein